MSTSTRGSGFRVQLPGAPAYMQARVLGSGFWVLGFGFSGFWVLGSGFWVQGSGLRVQGFRAQGSGFMVHGSGFWALGSGFRVQGSGFRVRGLQVRPGAWLACVPVCTMLGSGIRVHSQGIKCTSRVPCRVQPHMSRVQGSGSRPHLAVPTHVDEHLAAAFQVRGLHHKPVGEGVGAGGRVRAWGPGAYVRMNSFIHSFIHSRLWGRGGG